MMFLEQFFVQSILSFHTHSMLLITLPDFIVYVIIIMDIMTRQDIELKKKKNASKEMI